MDVELDWTIPNNIYEGISTKQAAFVSVANIWNPNLKTKFGLGRL